MTIDHGSVEPVDAGEPIAQHDDLENWLHGIRTDLTDNPPDWLSTVSDSPEAPLDTTTPPAVDTVDTGPQARGEQTTGRHRAAE